MQSKISLPAIIVFFLMSISLQAQNTNFRAQAHYYSAKENYQKGNDKEALSYIIKAKESLKGTNQVLQYLHILVFNRMKQYENAQQELQTFFDITDNKIEEVHFSKEVDKLTQDETYQLTKMINHIMEAVEKRKNNPCKKCNGKGIKTKIEYYECGHCDNATKRTSRTYVDPCGQEIQGAGMGSYYHRKKGEVRTKCTACDGVGWRVCSKCAKTCKYDHKGDCESSNGEVGFSFYCKECDGSGYKFSLCTVCQGKKTMSRNTGEQVSCEDCYGEGFLSFEPSGKMDLATNKESKNAAAWTVLCIASILCCCWVFQSGQEA